MCTPNHGLPHTVVDKTYRKNIVRGSRKNEQDPADTRPAGVAPELGGSK